VSSSLDESKNSPTTKSENSATNTWNAKLDNTLKEMGFQQSMHEAPVHPRGSCRSVLLVGVYIDDIVITDAEAEIEAFKAQMKATF